MPEEPQIQSAGEPVHVQQPPVEAQPVGQDVVQPPSTNETSSQEQNNPQALPVQNQAPEPKVTDKVKLGKPKLPQKEKSPNVNAAIAATVIIVLVLAVLAVLAYLKTKK